VVLVELKSKWDELVDVLILQTEFEEVTLEDLENYHVDNVLVVVGEIFVLFLSRVPSHSTALPFSLEDAVQFTAGWNYLTYELVKPRLSF